VLAQQFGEDAEFTATSPNLPSVSRSFIRFSAAVAQVIDARVFGGIHFRFAGQIGAAVGARIGHWTVDTQMTPA
jgi:hypothetical protein